MRASEPRRTPAALLGAALLLACAPSAARAWSDPFGDWQAHGYAQVLQIDRPSDGLPPYGVLDSNGDAASGYLWDGLQFRDLDARLSGPLGWDGWGAALEAQVVLGTASIADLYARWDGPWGALRFGQAYLPFGVEQQTSKDSLPSVQRGLLYGFEDYGHVQPWGLQLLNQRGWGARWDGRRDWGAFTGTAAAAAQDFNGGALYQNALGAVGRAGLAWERGAWSLGGGLSGEGARAEMLSPATSFAPLGAAQGAPFQASAPLAGHRLVATGGADLEASAGPASLGFEAADQDLDGRSRGGGQLTVQLGLGSALRAWGAPERWRAARLYGKWEAVASSFGDGVHQAGALYAAQTYGLALPTGWDWASVDLECLFVSSSACGGILPDGRIYQAQLQFRL